MKLKKSTILSDTKIKVGTSLYEFSAREMEAVGLRNESQTPFEKNLYMGIIFAVPFLIVASIGYTFYNAS